MSPLRTAPAGHLRIRSVLGEVLRKQRRLVRPIVAAPYDEVAPDGVWASMASVQGVPQAGLLIALP